ncbi:MULTISPECIES: glycosyltransferase family 2 protein [Marinomonas]|nr:MULTISPECIES: glycosyltransferase family 2 protein [Marinomonas]
MMIQILLATYNGAKYLEAQLDSLLSQTYTDWTLIAHDDGSTDKTCDILRAYQSQYPDIIEILEDGVTFGCARDNFTYLLEASTAEYVMFCDQDDVWLPEKIAKTFYTMQQLEGLHKGLPIVVHTDLMVVDESLGSIAPSMFDYQGLNRSIDGLLQILAKNTVTGCTMMINRRAISSALPMSACAVMHDWWIAANVIKQQGVIGFIDESLIQYRQHSSNSVGTKKNSILGFMLRCINSVFDEEVRKKAWRQAKVIDPTLSWHSFFLKKLSLH